MSRQADPGAPHRGSEISGRIALHLLLGLVLAGSLAACGRERTRPADLTEEMVDAQITNLRSEDFTVRRCAARALGRIGPRAIKAVPALLRALEDSESTVRSAAGIAIDRIDPSARPHVLVRAEQKGAFRP